MEPTKKPNVATIAVPEGMAPEDFLKKITAGLKAASALNVQKGKDKANMQALKTLKEAHEAEFKGYVNANRRKAGIPELR